eukprot:jgi/Bigna1/72389/fgenesh1_pg.19_\
MRGVPQKKQKRGAKSRPPAGQSTAANTSRVDAIVTQLRAQVRAYGAQAKRHAGTLERIRKGAAKREKEAADQAEELKRQIRQLQREKELEKSKIVAAAAHEYRDVYNGNSRGNERFVVSEEEDAKGEENAKKDDLPNGSHYTVDSFSDTIAAYRNLQVEHETLKKLAANRLAENVELKRDFSTRAEEAMDCQRRLQKRAASAEKVANAGNERIKELEMSHTKLRTLVEELMNTEKKRQIATKRKDEFWRNVATEQLLVESEPPEDFSIPEVVRRQQTWNSDLFSKIKAKLKRAEEEVRVLQNMLTTEKERNKKLHAERLQEIRRLKGNLSRSESRLLGAVRRVRFLLDQKKKAKEKEKKRDEYIGRLEAKVLEAANGASFRHIVQAKMLQEDGGTKRQRALVNNARINTTMRKITIPFKPRQRRRDLPEPNTDEDVDNYIHRHHDLRSHSRSSSFSRGLKTPSSPSSTDDRDLPQEKDELIASGAVPVAAASAATDDDSASENNLSDCTHNTDDLKYGSDGTAKSLNEHAANDDRTLREIREIQPAVAVSKKKIKTKSKPAKAHGKSNNSLAQPSKKYPNDEVLGAADIAVESAGYNRIANESAERLMKEAIIAAGDGGFPSLPGGRSPVPIQRRRGNKTVKLGYYPSSPETLHFPENRVFLFHNSHDKPLSRFVVNDHRYRIEALVLLPRAKSSCYCCTVENSLALSTTSISTATSTVPSSSASAIGADQAMKLTRRQIYPGQATTTKLSSSVCFDSVPINHEDLSPTVNANEKINSATEGGKRENGDYVQPEREDEQRQHRKLQDKKHSRTPLNTGPEAPDLARSRAGASCSLDATSNHSLEKVSVKTSSTRKKLPLLQSSTVEPVVRGARAAFRQSLRRARARVDEILSASSPEKSQESTKYD